MDKKEIIVLSFAVVIVMMLVTFCGGLIYVIPVSTYAIIDAVFGTNIPINFWTISGTWFIVLFVLMVASALGGTKVYKKICKCDEDGKDEDDKEIL